MNAEVGKPMPVSDGIGKANGYTILVSTKKAARPRLGGFKWQNRIVKSFI